MREIKTSNGVTVVLSNEPNLELFDSAMRDLVEKVRERKRKEDKDAA